ncbi:MAG: hypothetical protein R3E66_03510 [bacterium]
MKLSSSKIRVSNTLTNPLVDRDLGGDVRFGERLLDLTCELEDLFALQDGILRKFAARLTRVSASVPVPSHGVPSTLPEFASTPAS